MSINVKDASGSTVAIEVPNSNGQAAMANSAPVAIASDQSAIPVSGPLTDTQLRATPVPVSGTVTATGPATNAELRATALPVESPGFVSAVDTTRPADTTAYTALDVLGESPAANLVFTDVGSVAGGHVIIMDVSFRQDVDAIPSGQDGFRLHLFDAAPTAIADNAAFNLIAADRTKYLGSIDLESSLDLGDTLWSRSNNINFKCKLASASTTLYGVLQTIAGFTPSASTARNVRISGIQC